MPLGLPSVELHHDKQQEEDVWRALRESAPAIAR
jgi:hypothetical protein